MAFDFDGTLAVNGNVPAEVETALEQCRDNGHVLFLVTGRRFETVVLGHLGDLFAGIVWENGAVLTHTASGETYLPFGQLDARLLKAIEEAGIPFERGLAIAATWTPHDQALWGILRSHGGSTSIEYNKSAVMVLPPGATKGTGLERLLALCGLSPRNLAAFGDAENDLSMLTLAEVSVAVADAVPAVIETSDVLATAPGPQGVLEILKQYPLGGKFLDIPLKRERPILLGQTESGAVISIPAARLAGRNLGVFGNSATGKSWMVGLIAEGLHHEEYQVLLIDPEGDFRGLRVLPRFVSASGDRTTLPPPSAVVSLLDEGGVSGLDLSQYPLSLRSHYLAELIRALRPMREQKFRPHSTSSTNTGVVYEGSEVTALLRPLLETGGWAFVSYRPDRLSESVLTSLHHCLLTRLTDRRIRDCLRTHCAVCGFKMQASIISRWQRPSLRRRNRPHASGHQARAPCPPSLQVSRRASPTGETVLLPNREGPPGDRSSQFIRTVPPDSDPPPGEPRIPRSSRGFCEMGRLDARRRRARRALRKVANRHYQGEELREALNQVVSTHTKNSDN